MNDFTKEELSHLKACVSCAWLTGYSPSVQICDDLHAKLQFMIDNYSENEFCIVKNCKREVIHKGLGLCHPHYCAFKRHGTPLVKTRVCKGYYENVICKVEGCTREVKTKGICAMHYSRDFRLKKKGLPFKYQNNN